MNPGDKLTTVVSWSDPATGAYADGCAVRATVARSWTGRQGTDGFAFDNGTLFLPNGTTVAVDIVGEHRLDDEGVTWIPGWPPLNDEAVLALVTAHAMEQGAVPSKLFEKDDWSTPNFAEPWRYDLDGYMDDDFEARGLVR